jgi:hypothetical protein
MHPALVRKITIPVGQDAAFRRFTEGLAAWWPMKTHSVGQEQTTDVTLEPRVGGRFYETQADGTTSDWGRLTVWDPPNRLAFTWHPGRDPEAAQNVEIAFRRVGDTTEIELTHRDWEVFGDEAGEMRDRYGSGWDGVLQRYSNVQL